MLCGAAVDERRTADTSSPDRSPAAARSCCGSGVPRVLVNQNAAAAASRSRRPPRVLKSVSSSAVACAAGSMRTISGGLTAMPHCATMTGARRAAGDVEIGVDAAGGASTSFVRRPPRAREIELHEARVLGGEVDRLVRSGAKRPTGRRTGRTVDVRARRLVRGDPAATRGPVERDQPVERCRRRSLAGSGDVQRSCRRARKRPAVGDRRRCELPRLAAGRRAPDTGGCATSAYARGVAVASWRRTPSTARRATTSRSMVRSPDRAAGRRTRRRRRAACRPADRAPRSRLERLHDERGLAFVEPSSQWRMGKCRRRATLHLRSAPLAGDPPVVARRPRARVDAVADGDRVAVGTPQRRARTGREVGHALRLAAARRRRGRRSG